METVEEQKKPKSQDLLAVLAVLEDNYTTSKERQLLILQKWGKMTLEEQKEVRERLHVLRPGLSRFMFPQDWP